MARESVAGNSTSYDNVPISFCRYFKLAKPSDNSHIQKPLEPISLFQIGFLVGTPGKALHRRRVADSCLDKCIALQSVGSVEPRGRFLGTNDRRTIMKSDCGGRSMPVNFRRLFHDSGKVFVRPDQVVYYLRDIRLFSFCNFGHK